MEGELPGQQAATLQNRHNNLLLYIHHAHMRRHSMTTWGTHALFVVNSVKLHLTALRRN